MRNELNQSIKCKGNDSGSKAKDQYSSQLSKPIKSTNDYEVICSTSSSSQSTVENETDILLQVPFEINVDDLIECQEHIELLIKSLKGKTRSIAPICLDLRDFYFKSIIYKRIPISLLNNKNSQLSLISEKLFKYLYIVILITYDSSFNHSLFKIVLSLLNMTLLHFNRLILLLLNYYKDNISISISKSKMQLLNEILESKLSMSMSTQSTIATTTTPFNQQYVIQISNAMSKLIASLHQLINKYKITSIGNEIQGFYENITLISIEDIDLFFQGEVYRNSSISLSSSSTYRSKDDNTVSYILLNSIKSYSVHMSHYSKYTLTPSTVNTTNKYYTLVLDLDETLVHFASGNQLEGKVLFRPFLFEFLKTVSQYYEIILFTASVKEYADIILNLIEAKIGHKVFDHRLYREHTSYINGKYVKDLNTIGRDLSRIVIIDNNDEAFSKQKDNGIQIASFVGITKKDHCLDKLCDILLAIAKEDVRKRDIRVLIREYTQEITQRVSQQ